MAIRSQPVGGAVCHSVRASERCGFLTGTDNQGDFMRGVWLVMTAVVAVCVCHYEAAGAFCDLDDL